MAREYPHGPGAELPDRDAAERSETGGVAPLTAAGGPPPRDRPTNPGLRVGRLDRLEARMRRLQTMIWALALLTVAALAGIRLMLH